jgi:hypothetical protein
MAVEAETPVHTPMFSSTATIGDGGLLSEQSCKPPCLWGMTPGITREAEAWEILKSKDLTNACGVWDTTTGGTRGIQCYWDNGSITIGLESQQDAIRFVAFPPSNTIHISDIIEKYGAPTWVAVWEGDNPEHIAVEVAVFYDEIATRLDFRSQDGMVYNLRPETEIVGVSYLSPQQYTEFIKSMEGALFSWSGYGEYQRK